MRKKVGKKMMLLCLFLCYFNNVIAMSNPIDTKFSINKNILNCEEQVEVTLHLENISKERKIKEIHAYLDYDEAVFETVHEKDVKIFGASIPNAFHEASKEIYQKCDLAIQGNVKAIKVNLKVKEQTSVKQGYIQLKEVYLIDANHEKIEFDNYEIAVKVKQNHSLVNSSNKMLDTIKTSVLPNQVDTDYIIFQNINLLKIPVEGFAIIVFSFGVVLLFHIFVKMVLKIGKYIRKSMIQKNALKNIEQIFENIKY